MSKKETCYWCNGKGCYQCGGVGYYEILTRDEVEKIEREARRDYESRTGGRPQ